jgi:hypothetical protein
MLELLAFAPGETKSLALEWPEGEKLRLREPKKGGAWGVGLRHHGGWFEPEGTVELSDESLVAFADLIRSLAGSRGRFVRLAEGDYIRLDKNIRRKLRRYCVCTRRSATSPMRCSTAQTSAPASLPGS